MEELQYRAFRMPTIKPDDNGRYRWLLTGAGINRMGETTRIKGIHIADRTLPLLYNHNHRDVIGRVGDFERTDAALHGSIEFDVDDFSALIEGKVQRGIIDTASIGFIAHEYEWRDGEEDDDYPLPIDVKRMELVEVSIAPVPADISAKAQRSMRALKPNARQAPPTYTSAEIMAALREVINA